MSIPQQRPGRSKQDYETPPEFIAAVERRFGPLAIDLACRPDNRKAPLALYEGDNSLSVDWTRAVGPGQTAWLNPPYRNIAPWVRKCAEWAHGFRYADTSILVLVPASIGANWFRDYVHGRAFVWALNGRIQFVGAKDPYPKDCMLLEYGKATGFCVWTW